MTLKPELIRKLFRFGLVGGVVMLTFMGLNLVFGKFFSAQVAFFMAYPPALALHYVLNRWWTFESKRTDHRRQLGEYLGMVVITFLVQYSIFRVSCDWIGLPGWLSAGIANAGQMILSFVLMQRKVFAEKSGSNL
jgi:putative flippase GtrA